MDEIYQTPIDATHPPNLVPGDCVFFLRRTLREAGLIGWLSDALTALAQWLWCSTAQGHYDGLYNIVHVGVCVEWHGTVMLLEWVPSGMRLMNAEMRLGMHDGGIIILPLSERYRNTAFFSPQHVYRWIEDHRHYGYRWLGLIFSILHTWLGAACPGRFFCSEAVMNLYRYLGIVPTTLPVLRGGRVAQGEVLPHAYAPCEVADLPQLSRARMRRYR